jgi:hypothetical protein
VIDGTHRLLIARELGLEMLPVQVVSIPLPLSDADQIRIERTAVLETIARRQLTRHQMDVWPSSASRRRLRWSSVEAGMLEVRRGQRGLGQHRAPGAAWPQLTSCSRSAAANRLCSRRPSTGGATMKPLALVTLLALSVLSAPLAAEA